MNKAQIIENIEPITDALVHALSLAAIKITHIPPVYRADSYGRYGAARVVLHTPARLRITFDDGSSTQFDVSESVQPDINNQDHKHGDNGFMTSDPHQHTLTIGSPQSDLIIHPVVSKFWTCGQCQRRLPITQTCGCKFKHPDSN